MATGNFVIFHMGRCGSTVLQSQLRASGGVLHDGEAFADLYYLRKEKKPDLTPQQFLRRRQRRAARRGLIYGCEIKYPTGTQLDRIGVMRPRAPGYFARLGFTRFVLLVRTNLLDRLISQAVAVQRGSYTRAAGEQGVLGPVHLPLEGVRFGANRLSLIETLTLLERETAEMRAVLAAAAPDVLELSYEGDILGDPNRGAGKLARHVGLDYVATLPKLEKVVTKPKEDLVENYHELAACLMPTRFAWMLSRDAEQEVRHG